MIGKASFKTCVVASRDEEKVIAVRGQNEGVVVSRNKKEQDFGFSLAIYDDDILPLYRETIVPIVLLLNSGYNASLFLLSRDERQRNAITFSSDGLLPFLFHHLFGELSARSDIRSFDVSMQGFEVFSEHVRDLLDLDEKSVPEGATRLPNRPNESHKRLRIRQNKALGTHVAGLAEWCVIGPESALGMCTTLFSRRMGLYVTQDQSDLRDSTHLGAVSHLFMRLKVSTVSRSGQKQDAILQVTDLACAEALSYTPPSGENYIFYMPMHVFANETTHRAKPEIWLGTPVREGQELWANNLKSGMRSLSTLVRIVRSLRDTTTTAHVPYRDSHFTRILEPVLSGNFAPFAVCMPGGPGPDAGSDAESGTSSGCVDGEGSAARVQGASNLLRLASELQAISNYIFTARSGGGAVAPPPPVSDSAPSSSPSLCEGANGDEGAPPFDETDRTQGMAPEVIDVFHAENDALKDLLALLRAELAALKADMAMPGKSVEDRRAAVLAHVGCDTVTVDEARLAGVEYFQIPPSSRPLPSPRASIMAAAMPTATPNATTPLPAHASSPSSPSPSSLRLPAISPRRPVSVDSEKKGNQSHLVLLGRKKDQEEGHDGGDLRGTSTDPGMRWGGIGPPRFESLDAGVDAEGGGNGHESGHALIQMQGVHCADRGFNFCGGNRGKYDDRDDDRDDRFDDDDDGDDDGDGRAVMLPSPWSLRNTHKNKAPRRGKELREHSHEDDYKGDTLSEAERTFLRAVSMSKYSVAGDQLRQGVDVHVQNVFKRDGMQIAARNCDVKMLILLHRFGGRVNSRGPKGESLIHMAAYNGGVRAIAWAVEHGGVPWSVDMRGQHALHYSARRCNLDATKYLHEELGLDITQEDFEGQTPYALVPRVSSDEDAAIMRKYFEDNGIIK